jgi:hypothetical protein
MENLSWDIRESWFGEPLLVIRWPLSGEGKDLRVVVEEIAAHRESLKTWGAFPSVRLELFPINHLGMASNRSGNEVRIASLPPGSHRLQLTWIGEGASQPVACGQFCVLIPDPPSRWARFRTPLYLLFLSILLLFWRRSA